MLSYDELEYGDQLIVDDGYYSDSVLDPFAPTVVDIVHTGPRSRRYRSTSSSDVNSGAIALAILIGLIVISGAGCGIAYGCGAFGHVHLGGYHPIYRRPIYHAPVIVRHHYLALQDLHSSTDGILKEVGVGKHIESGGSNHFGFTMAVAGIIIGISLFAILQIALMHKISGTKEKGEKKLNSSICVGAINATMMMFAVGATVFCVLSMTSAIMKARGHSFMSFMLRPIGELSRSIIHGAPGVIDESAVKCNIAICAIGIFAAVAVIIASIVATARTGDKACIGYCCCTSICSSNATNAAICCGGMSCCLS